MKKFLLMTALMLSMAFTVDAQLYAPCYANYQGVGYFVLPNGYYYGQIYAGYPQGEDTIISLTRRWEPYSITAISTVDSATVRER